MNSRGRAYTSNNQDMLIASLVARHLSLAYIWIKLARRSIVKLCHRLRVRKAVMKILQICSASEMGGGEVHVADLVRGLASRGHAVYLAVRPDSPLRDPLAGVIASWHEVPLRNSLDLQSARIISDL